MRLWRIPDSGEQGTEYVVRAETPEEAIAKCEAYAAAERRFGGQPPRYDEIEEITEDVYPVPLYGYSW